MGQKPGDRRDVHQFFRKLSNRDEAGLPAICCGLLGPPSLSWSERTRSQLLKSFHEILTPQRSPGVRAVPQYVQVGCRLRVIDELPPLGSCPPLPPAFHFQHRVWGCRTKVSRGARPSPQFRRRHHACAHRIQLDIAQRCPQMRFIQRTGIESPLPYVPGRRLLGIPVCRVASMRLFERLRERLRGSGNRDQVHVIRHEAVAQQGESVTLRILPQQLKVSDAVRIAGENDLSGIPPLRNMMRNVDDHDTRQPSHSMKIAEITWPADNDGVVLPL